MMMAKGSAITLWLRWVAANALGEMLGLGLASAITAYVFGQLEGIPGAVAALVAFGGAVLSGLVEATIVGVGQWWAMHPWFPAITRRVWWRATLIGALIAYVLGYLPSTIMSLAESSSSSPAPAQPPQWAMLLFAAGLGIVGGALLSFAQWIVLRRHVAGAGWWVPANVLAWVVGMPVVFWAIDAAQRVGSLPGVVALLAGCLLVVGTLVGAIHGVFLVRLARQAGACG